MKTKFINITDVQAGRFTETVIDHNASPMPDYDPISDLQESIFKVAAEKGYRNHLLEAFVNTPDSANLLRDGIRYLAFSSYSEMPQSFGKFAQTMTSNKPQEEWLRDSTMGVLPRVKSGAETPYLLSQFDAGVTIVNNRYAGLVEVTGDDIRFDRLGKIRQIAPELGRAARMTQEAEVYATITTTGNYTRNSTTGDNDIGANTGTVTFSGIALENALATIATMKDRKSGAYLGFGATTLIVGPRLEVAAKQLLMSAEVGRTGASEVRGTGSTNPYRGLVNQIIVSPWFGSSYQWALVDTSRTSFVFQVVEPLNIAQESQDATSESWLTRDVTRYLVQMYFGMGFVDDRAWYYSDSTTAPTVS